MKKDTRTTIGIGNVQFIASLLVIALVAYVLFQLLYPYYAYQRLESTMEEGAEIAVQRSDRDDTEMMDKIRWLIDRYKIPLDPDDIRVEYDRERKVLSVSAEYDVYVEFPGYTHHYHFQPYAEAKRSEVY
jgi:hypothetical protein